MRAWHLVGRHALSYRRAWFVFLSGFLEPVFYLMSIGVGVGAMIHDVQVGGEAVPYAVFVAPAMLAASAMNGAIMDSTFNLFFRMRYDKLYESVLTTPLTVGDIALGELIWSLSRGGIYAAGFLGLMAAMGLTLSWWAFLALPSALLIGFAFAGVGMWVSSRVRSWQDFEFVNLALMPMMLFSGTFFPVDAVSGPVRWAVEVTPLYRGVVLCRELTMGVPGWASILSVGYLLAMGSCGLWGARRRLARLLMK
ncbi:lipooligosaccharide transport system permease protein [Austwickia chelonae]|uniref:Transport permease protein n=1 Tax=Austwickia chelonae NBRC 105200 TaxID=1184607 RepID=K6UNZ1_9MICO|nr:ABC transporter permease [Austwickia chelonae]GAB79371.1 putative ABC transporter permease protein [Austwickia chelonae NBRC 105200]SEW43793.1 lipooligosaccharide transport system permease protein [Austwickia chelonae]